MNQFFFFISPIFQIGITIIPLMWDAEWPNVIIKKSATWPSHLDLQ